MRTLLSWNTSFFLGACVLAASLATAACSGGGGGSGGTGGTGSSGTTGGSTGSGGPVAGDVDKHCGSTVAKVDPATCMGAGGSGGGTMTGSGGSGGSTGTTTDTMPASEYGETLYNAEGDDDDCKYHVKFSSTDVGQGKDVTFTVTVTSIADGKPVTGAAPDIEAFLSDIHPAPNSAQKPTEKGNGVYDIGPMKFDAAGKWTVRFHFFEECTDSETSPHSHVAFYLNVP